MRSQSLSWKHNSYRRTHSFAERVFLRLVGLWLHHAYTGKLFAPSEVQGARVEVLT